MLKEIYIGDLLRLMVQREFHNNGLDKEKDIFHHTIFDSHLLVLQIINRKVLDGRASDLPLQKRIHEKNRPSPVPIEPFDINTTIGTK
jgi:hypothetical protein